MSHTDAMVFDIGGVLIDWDPRHLYRTLFDDERAMETFLTEICSPAWNHRTDLGQPFAEAVDQLVDEYPQHADLIAAYDQRWDEMVAGPIQGTVEIAAELRAAGVGLYGLTNFSTEKLPVAIARCEALTWFEGIVVSGAEGVTKPDAEIYRTLCERFDLVPSRTIFTDDKAANVAAALELGFRAIPFRSPDQLRTALISHGLPLREPEAAGGGGRP
jgi:2-haloacid dehalogenase